MTNQPNSEPAKTRLLSGSIWMLGMQWTVRLSGLISTVILARLLAPEDFGIIAMAKIALGLLEALATVGVDLALIRHPDPTREHYDSAWTIRLLQRAGLAIILFFAAPAAAGYFDEPRTLAVIRLLAVATLLRGFLNIGVVEFRRSLQFSREFKLGVLEKLISVVAAITLAVVLRNYWALAIAIPLQSVVGVALSYLMHPYRPRISFARFTEIWTFSMWLLTSRLGYFLNRRLDQILVGGSFSTQSMGYYNFAAELGLMPGVELSEPMRRAVYPNLSALLAEPQRFDRTILNVLGLAALLLIPVGFGLAATAPEFVYLVFGEKWLTTIPLLQSLAILGVFAGLSGLLELPLLVNHQERLSALESWLHMTAVLLVLLPVVATGRLDYVAIARTALGGAFMLVMAALSTRASGLTLANLAGAVWRSFLGGAVMVAVLTAVDLAPEASPLLRLLEKVLLGAAVYCSVVGLLWFMTGRPPGAEQNLLSHLRRAPPG